MPKASRTKQEIELIRDMILDTALQLIIDGGFSSLSMRRIASRLGITATTIYNYVSCKDELNLLIRMRALHAL
jgi:AcrR family transcriptional regulator